MTPPMNAFCGLNGGSYIMVEGVGVIPELVVDQLRDDFVEENEGLFALHADLCD